MYLSSNKYPEFSGKDKAYKKECLNFCIAKTGYKFRFWVAVFFLLAASVIWSAWLEPLLFEESTEIHGITHALVLGGLFWLYLIYEVNITIYPAVKRYIGEFNAVNKNT